MFWFLADRLRWGSGWRVGVRQENRDRLPFGGKGGFSGQSAPSCAEYVDREDIHLKVIGFSYLGEGQSDRICLLSSF